MKLKTSSLAAALLVTGSVASAAVVDFDVAGDLTSSFRELRSNTNESHQSTAGSNGDNGFLRYNAGVDSGAFSYVYDANGATAGTSTFTSGYVAMDVKWDTINRFVGLFVASSNTDALGWHLRLDNSGNLENSVVRYGANLTNNFTAGTALTTTSGTAMIAGAATPAFASGTSTDTFSNANLSINNWYSMRMDFGLDGSNQRTIQIRVWDNILDSNGVGTGTLRWDQNFTISGTAYNGALEVGMWAKPNSISTANIDIDNFHAAVPEPSAFAALAGLGALGLAASRRRRRA